MVRIFGLAFLIALTGAMVPGPVLALVIGQVLAQGLAAALLVTAGHAILEALLVAGFAVGLSRLLSSARVRGLCSLLGGAVLVWMGYGMVRQASGVSLTGAEASPLPWYALMLAGAGVSLANPYFTGWWATVGTGQVATFGLESPREYAVFYLGHELGDVVWYGFVAAVLVLGKGWFTDATYRWLVWGCGLVIA
ncbi:MAG: LysE family translocator, partial [Armatimonadetes bacterium]|nr:LysE family translocator [Armatimonadota bacterium]